MCIYVWLIFSPKLHNNTHAHVSQLRTKENITCSKHQYTIETQHSICLCKYVCLLVFLSHQHTLNYTKLDGSQWTISEIKQRPNIHGETHQVSQMHKTLILSKIMRKYIITLYFTFKYLNDNSKIVLGGVKD